LARRFDVSKEAMARAYADYHPETIAIVVCKDARILWLYKNPLRFPFVQPSYGQPVPRGSSYHRVEHATGVTSGPDSCIPDLWINVERGRRAPALFEQVYPQRDGYALILLKLEKPDEEEEEEERALERSWRVGFRR
jgi:hypothetical protein